MLLSSLCFFVHSQSTFNKDSVWANIKTQKYDSVKIKSYLKLKIQYSKEQNFDSARIAIEMAIKLAANLKRKYYKLLTINQRGYYFEIIGEPDSALAVYSENSKEELNNDTYTEIYSAISHIGDYYYDKGDYNTALLQYQKALRVAEKYQDSTKLMTAYNDIGNIYLELKRPRMSLSYHNKALNFIRSREKLEFTCQAFVSLFTSYSEIARQFEKKDCLDSALYFAREALKFSKKLDPNSFFVNYAYTCIGSGFYDYHQYDSAIFYLQKGITNQKNEAYENSITAIINLSWSYTKIKEYKKAELYCRELLKNSKNYLGYKDYLEIYHILSIAESNSNNFIEAYKYMELTKLYNDSVYNESSSEKRKELEMNFEFEKQQEQQKAEQEKKDLITAQELKEQKQQRIYFAIGLVFALLFSGYVLLSLKKQRKANKIISEQKTEVEQQKHLVEEKQKEIIDSIRYAKRIQQSLLPTEKYIDKKTKR